MPSDTPRKKSPPIDTVEPPVGATHRRRVRIDARLPVDALERRRPRSDGRAAALPAELAGPSRNPVGIPVDGVGLDGGIGTRVRRHTVSVVIPTLNEARNIAWVLRRLPSVDEVILVDGRSTDSTIAIARAIRPDVKIVLEGTPGKGAALRAGFAAATSDLVVMIDADGSMNPGEIESFITLLAAGHEFVKGSRFLPGGGTTDMTPVRRIGNWGLMAAANLLFGRRFSDLCYGFCAFRRESLAALALDANGFEIETQICVRAAKANLRTAEVPSFEAPRMHGESNLNTFRDGWRVLRTIVRERVSGAPSIAAPEPQLVPVPITRDDE